ncbi:hypothetical protein SPAN111604_03515 [Sphingomonas antarctica]|uniref:energy transducer TonB n=1 Tax=Sphingomonas antarctica TaxID=2040274 RepID=UPI0039E9FB03
MPMFVAPILLAVAAPVAAPAPTLQQRFQDASDAAASGQCAEAVASFESLENTPAGKTRQVRGAMLSRKSACLLNLRRYSDAAAAASEALRLLALTPPATNDDVTAAHITLGQLAYYRHAYAESAAEMRLARDASTTSSRFRSLLWLARATMYDDGGEALATADAARAMIDPASKTAKADTALTDTLRGRILLNHGDVAGGYTLLKKALAAQGGLKDGKVSLSEVVTRSDLALAALLNHDADSAREYLAYTGAGRFEKSSFASASIMDAPPCGGEAGLLPTDLAVVEFSVTDDGSVLGATPIYVSRSGAAAARGFAEAVDDWTWSAANAVAIPQFFRAVTRVELRCSVATRQADVTAPMETHAWAWLTAHGAEDFHGATPTARAAAARAVAADRQAKPAWRLAAMIALARDPVALRDDSLLMLAQADELAAALAAPPSVRATIALSRIKLGANDDWRLRRSSNQAALDRLTVDPDLTADPEVAATIRLIAAQSRRSSDVSQTPFLRAVADDSRLPAESPLRAAALLRLANVQAGNGQTEQARATYGQTGLNAQQCSLIDLKPAMTRSGASGADFPMEAMRWGFEGWVRAEFDVAPDGRTANPRAIIAYPPLVFRDAGLGIIRSSRWEPRFRPEGGLACGGMQQNIRFLLPK